MLKCGRFCAVLLLFFSVTQMGFATDQPPATSQQADGHWSAWQAPSRADEATETHTIEPGDTLWSLAERFYGDPYSWPQLWERNRYIEDSHWIYPGDTLVVGSYVAPIDQVAALTGDDSGGASGETAGADSEEGGLRLDRKQSAPEALGSEDDIYCSGYIGEFDREFDRQIVGSEYENLSPRLSSHRTSVKGLWGTVDTVKLGLTTGDIVYLDGGEAAGMTTGSLYSVVTPKERVAHPRSGQSVGRFYKYSGRLRVLSVQETTAIGEIVHGCDPIFVGARLEPFQDEPIPLARRPHLRAVNDPASTEQIDAGATIVRSMFNIVSLGQGHVVFVDRGAAQDVAPGDIYTIYRPNDPGLPAVVVGELGILSVESDTAMAKILESRYTVHLGDRLDLETR